MSTRQNPMRSVRQKPVPPPSNVFTVEKVLKKRITREGSEEFLIKWQGFPESESTWEPRSNLQCDEMIYNYERYVKRTQNRKRRCSPEPEEPAFYEPSDDEPWAGKPLQEIIGLTKTPGELHFLCKFDDESIFMVPSKDIYARFPSEIIKFYETRLALNGTREDQMPTV